jgi:stage 0 sporulation regulatory protein
MVTMRIHKTFTEKDRLEHMISQLRSEMIQSAAATGLNSHRTIYYSQKLDKLITIYQKHFYHMDTNERMFHSDIIV